VNDADMSEYPCEKDMNMSTNLIAEQLLMDIATGNDIEIDIETNAIKTFHHNSLMLVTYLWDSVAIIKPNLSKLFNKGHFTYVSLTIHPMHKSNSLVLQHLSVALNKFDIKLAATSMTQAYVWSALQDI
jgi:hypothetical protein